MRDQCSLPLLVLRCMRMQCPFSVLSMEKAKNRNDNDPLFIPCLCRFVRSPLFAVKLHPSLGEQRRGSMPQHRKSNIKARPPACCDCCSLPAVFSRNCRSVSERKPKARRDDPSANQDPRKEGGSMARSSLGPGDHRVAAMPLCLQ